MLESGDIKLYPNPANNNITIALSSSTASNETNYQIIDLNSKVVRKGDLVNSTIDVSLLDIGVYFVRIEQGGEVLGGKKVLVE